MKNNPSTTILLASYFLLSALTTTVAHAADKTADANSHPLVVQKLKKRNPAYLISVESVLRKLKQNQDLLLVDIRRQDDFERLRIPGSINLPLFAVKTKTFLKPKQLVLIEEGYRHSWLERECKRLRDAGFKISILNGGLNSWAHKRGPLEGDVFAKETFDRIPPRNLFEEKDFDHWVALDISNSEDDSQAPLMSHTMNVPFDGKPYEFSKALGRNLARLKNRKNLFFVIFNGDGRGYESLEKAIDDLGLTNHFFLEGGSMAYTHFLQDMSRQRVLRKDRLETLNKCSHCGDRG